MKRILPAIVCLLIGFGLGWSICYFGPNARHYRELLAEYRYARDNFQMTDAEMAQFGRDYKQFGKSLIREDEIATAIALGTFQLLENGDTDAAKARLLIPIAGYYRSYHDKNGDKSLLESIETAAKKYPSISAKISQKAD